MLMPAIFYLLMAIMPRPRLLPVVYINLEFCLMCFQLHDAMMMVRTFAKETKSDHNFRMGVWVPGVLSFEFQVF